MVLMVCSLGPVANNAEQKNQVPDPELGPASRLPRPILVGCNMRRRLPVLRLRRRQLLVMREKKARVAGCDEIAYRLLHCISPVLAQSGHRKLKPLCLLMMLWTAPALRHRSVIVVALEARATKEVKPLPMRKLEL
jgi:hypothetical protein